MLSLEETIKHRIKDRVPVKELLSSGISGFYIGGNCLNRSSPNDIDLFPSNGNRFPAFSAEYMGSVVSTTKNAITVKAKREFGGGIIQFCNYIHPTLESLINSFDFSHIQVGAEVKSVTDIRVVHTDAYISSKVVQTTEFVGSEYPLSSLVRSYKYKERGEFAGRSHIFSIIKMLTSIVERGYSSYEDFKDQLDAVDLGLVPEDFSGLEGRDVLDLYNALKKGQ